MGKITNREYLERKLYDIKLHKNRLQVDHQIHMALFNEKSEQYIKDELSIESQLEAMQND